MKIQLRNWFNPQARSLAVVALLIGSVLNVTHWLTRDRINHHIELKQRAQIIEVLQSVRYDNDPLTDYINVSNPLLANGETQRIYRARLNDQAVAAVISTFSADGYNGRIDMLVAISIVGEITGVRVTNHAETPGLGDDIDISKSRWITQFNSKSLRDPLPPKWRVIRDNGEFSQFTGATITPRAVISAIHQTLEFFLQNSALIFSETTSNG